MLTRYVLPAPIPLVEYESVEIRRVNIDAVSEQIEVHLMLGDPSGASSGQVKVQRLPLSDLSEFEQMMVAGQLRTLGFAAAVLNYFAAKGYLPPGGTVEVT